MTTAFALSCHPDDIEFMMAGTLLLLKDAGCRLHTMNLANGSCGSTELSAEEIVAVRQKESARAAELLGTVHHESLVNDIEVFYCDRLVRQVTAIVRTIAPDVILLPSPEDYMEDHMNTSRIGVTAAFCRGMPNYSSIPAVPPIARDVVLYHALPYGLADGLRRPIAPDLFVDISSAVDRKERLLACHESQRRWLDGSQGLDSYLLTMRQMSREVGRMSGRFDYAEGWRRHSHLGYSCEDTDVLQALLPGRCAARAT